MKFKNSFKLNTNFGKIIIGSSASNIRKLGEKEKVKSSRLVGVVSVITLIALMFSVSLVSALEQNEASVIAEMPGTERVRGEMSSVHIQFTSKTEKSLEIYNVGIHFDWMDKDQLYGISFSSNPKTVVSMKSVVFDIINYTVPNTASFGAHTYYIGVDGYDADGNPFSWTSDDRTIYVVSPSTSGEPTSTPTATDQNPQAFDLNYVIYGGIIAAAAIVIIVIAVMMKKRGTKPAAKPSANPTEPEQKPSDGQDFNI